MKGEIVKDREVILVGKNTVNKKTISRISRTGPENINGSKGPAGRLQQQRSPSKYIFRDGLNVRLKNR